MSLRHRRRRRLLALVLLLNLHLPTAIPDQCGLPFREAAAAALQTTQHPHNCATARLMVVDLSRNFEGLGSTLMGVSEALAEAHYSRRALIWGPAGNHPHVLRGAACGAALGYECYFRPLGPCRWSTSVHREEALNLHRQTDELRVKPSHPRRGGPALYHVPSAALRALLPTGTTAAEAAECWAASVVGWVMRLRPEVLARLQAVEATLALPRPVAAVHLRIGDNALLREDGSRYYGNKPLPGAAAMGKGLRAHLGINDEHGTKKNTCAGSLCGADDDNGGVASVFLATDAPPDTVQKRRRDLAGAIGLDVSQVTVIDRRRTQHGSHNTAFTPNLVGKFGFDFLAVPAEVYQAEYAATSALERTRMEELTRVEALEDLFLLSSADYFAGSAASHFSVMASLWGLARPGAARAGSSSTAASATSKVSPTTSTGSTSSSSKQDQGQDQDQPGRIIAASPLLPRPRTVGPFFLDRARVVSGYYANGFMHGKKNGTDALLRPEERIRSAARRLLEWPLSPRQAAQGLDLPVRFHPTRVVPIVDGAVVHQLATRVWRGLGEGGSDHTEAFCESRCAGHGIQLPVAGCDSASLVNVGADFQDSAYFKPGLARACWRRALMLPVAPPKPSPYETPADMAEIASVARENVAASLGKCRKKYRVHADSASTLPVRGRSDPNATDTSSEKGSSCAAEDGRRSTETLSVHVEGWRDIPHSFAVLARDLVRELATRPGVHLTFADAPLPPHWRKLSEQKQRRLGEAEEENAPTTKGRTKGVKRRKRKKKKSGRKRKAKKAGPAWLPASMARHRKIPILPFGANLLDSGRQGRGNTAAAAAPGPPSCRTVVLRMWYPFNTTAHPQADRTVVLAPTEGLRALDTDKGETSRPWSMAMATMLAPTHWAAEGLVRSGLPRRKIAIAPHGVDVSVFKPVDAAAKRRARIEFGLPQDRFIFLHVGAATPNKKVRDLVDAFGMALEQWDAARAADDPGGNAAADARKEKKKSRRKKRKKTKQQQKLEKKRRLRPMLVLKGLDALYNSDRATAEIPGLAAHVARNDSLYLGMELGREALARLYSAADAYVTASGFEGFGMPLVEAAAVGLPVVVPVGGAAEEVTHHASTRYVPSSPVTTSFGSVGVQVDVPSLAGAFLAVTRDGKSTSGGGDAAEGTSGVNQAPRQKQKQSLVDRARRIGPMFVSDKFRIERSVDMLLGVLQDEQWATQHSRDFGGAWLR